MGRHRVPLVDTGHHEVAARPAQQQRPAALSPVHGLPERGERRARKLRRAWRHRVMVVRRRVSPCVAGRHGVTARPGVAACGRGRRGARRAAAAARVRALLPGHAQPGHHDLNGRDDARERLEEEEGQ